MEGTLDLAVCFRIKIHRCTYENHFIIQWYPPRQRIVSSLRPYHRVTSIIRSRFLMSSTVISSIVSSVLDKVNGKRMGEITCSSSSSFTTSHPLSVPITCELILLCTTSSTTPSTTVSPTISHRSRFTTRQYPISDHLCMTLQVSTPKDVMSHVTSLLARDYNINHLTLKNVPVAQATERGISQKVTLSHHHPLRFPGNFDHLQGAIQYPAVSEETRLAGCRSRSSHRRRGSQQGSSRHTS